MAVNNYSSTSTSGLSNFYTINTNAYPNSIGTMGGFNGSYAYASSSSPSSSLHVKGDAEIEGNLKVKGKDLSELMSKIEDRLAILLDPDPEKLEQFAALKKAYQHYKTLEILCGNPPKDEKY